MTKAAELAKIVDASGNVVTSGTVEPAGDTAAGDNAAIGFTSAEGIVITGQGSTNDVTIKNDADADVIEIPTGTTNVTVAGTLTATGFIIGSADINENDLESIDGITAGTIAASKAAIVDTNKDITGFRNITLTGELDAATLDISGNADIDGTLEADAITIGGTAIASVLSPVAGSSSIVTTGALNAGSITSGFGNIDTGSSTITTTGLGTFGSLDISGDIDVDGTTNLDNTDIDGTLNVQGETTLQTHLNMGDNDKIKLGASQDLEIYHDGNDSNIADVGTGTLLLKTDGTGIFLQKGSSETLAQFKTDAEVNLYHNNSKKFETTSSGVTVTGDILTTNIYGASDGNTGIQWEGSDVLTFHSGGVENIQLTSNAIVFNQDSADMDFRIESNINGSMFFVDAGNDRIGINQDTPLQPLHLTDADFAFARFQTTAVSKTGMDVGQHQDGRGQINLRDSNDFTISTADTERMRISSAGNIAVAGTQSDKARFEIHKASSSVGGIADDTLHLATTQTTGRNINIGFGIGGALANTNAGVIGLDVLDGAGGLKGDFVFHLRNTTADATPAERMRLKSFGSLLINTTATLHSGVERSLEVLNHGGNGFVAIFKGNNKDHETVAIHNSDTSGTRILLAFKTSGSTGTLVGRVTSDGSTTNYATSSDYRLKENVSYDFDATTRLKQLKPARFNWIADEDNTTVDGFIAHEVSSIVPEAVNGDKDAVDADGNIDPQGIDQSKLVPLLVKTIQELEARITALEGA